MTIYEDEIDLRPYIDAVLKQWWKIGLLAFALAVFVLVFSILQKDSYQATATILVPNSQLKLSLSDQFPTIDAGDARSRMDAYLTIAKSDAIAQQTFQAVEGSLPEGYTVKNLHQNVEISNTGDAILIKATAPSAQLSADIANEWGNQTIQAINLAYSGEKPLEEIQLQIASAESKYQENQIALESFIEQNLVTEVQTEYDLAVAALNAAISDQTWQNNYLFQKKQAFTQLLHQANFFIKQVESGNSSNAGNVGDALAVMLARAASAHPSLDEASGNMIFQIPDPTLLVDTSSNYQKDIETIIQLSEDEYQAIIDEIDSQVFESNQDIADPYLRLTSEIQLLKAQLENLTARERELSSDRDLAWETYQALLQKETEIKTTAQTNPVVTFASSAIPPEDPESNQTIMKTLIAGVLGGMIGVLWVVIRMWWRTSQVAEPSNDNLPPEN
jgi:capsular polysaccharide biosynthesis protein